MSAEFELRSLLPETWREFLCDAVDAGSFRQLSSFLNAEYREQTVFPPLDDLFTAFRLTPPDRVKAVILGQDPYHDDGQAHGLAFSVRAGVRFPPSLRNIFKEIHDDIGSPIPASGDLTRWAKQGVLLLNATLTVRANLAGSHQKRGWETFTDAVISAVAKERKNIVYILWGSYAQQKAAMVDRSNNLVLESVHPSPLSASRGFFGNHHFSRANQYLIEHGMTPIEW